MEILFFVIVLIIIVSNYEKILSKLSNSYKQKIEAREYICSSLLKETFSAIEEMDLFLRSSDSFLSLEQANHILDDKGYLYDKLFQTDYKKLRKTADCQKLIYAKNLFVNKYRSFIQLVFKHNEYVLEKQFLDACELVGNVEGIKLDRQQMKQSTKTIWNIILPQLIEMKK